MKLAGAAIACWGVIAGIVIVWLHVASFSTPGMFGESMIGPLKFAILVIWIPTVFVGWRLRRDAPEADYWDVVLSGLPRWGRGIVNVTVFYAAGLMLMGAIWKLDPVTVMSGAALMFYTSATAVGISALRR